MRKLRKNHGIGILLPRTDGHAINVTCREQKDMITTAHLECLSLHHHRNPNLIWVFNVGPEVIVIHGVKLIEPALGPKCQDLLS